MDLSIVIPVYRSEKILPHLIEQIEASIGASSKVKKFEIILVNDASPDGSWSVIERLCKVKPNVKGIDLRKNTGQHNAIMAGLNNSSGHVIVMMDDDLQHSPRYIEELYSKIEEGYDVCYTRFKERKHSFWKILASKINDKVASIMIGKPNNLYLSPFKAIHSDIKNEIIKYSGPFAYVDGLILMVTSNIASITVDHYTRYEGKGNYTFIRGLMLWMKMATNFSIVPLRVASFGGLISSALGFTFAIFLIIKKITHNIPVQGWSSLIVTVLVLGGVQLIAIGAIGEYLGRTYININKKPQFVIRAKRNI